MKEEVFHMKKKIVSALLCATMVATMFAGCGSSGDSGDTPKDSSQASSDPAVSDSSDDGKVLNIPLFLADRTVDLVRLALDRNP